MTRAARRGASKTGSRRPGADGTGPRRAGRRLVRSVAGRVLLALLVAVVVSAGVVGYRAYLATPSGAPAEFLSGERPPGGEPVVVAAGASLTRATLSADWVGLLRDRSGGSARFVNAGVNGDTTSDLLGRVERDVIAPGPAAVVVLVGTNDVRDGVPLDESRANVTGIVERVRESTGAEVALLSLPPIGEDLDSPLNASVATYNAMLAEVAGAHGAAYLPTGERVTALVRAHGDGAPFAFDPLVSVRAAVDRYLLGRSFDEIARGNGLHVLVDHIHLGERGAVAVADVVDAWLTATELGDAP